MIYISYSIHKFFNNPAKLDASKAQDVYTNDFFMNIAYKKDIKIAFLEYSLQEIIFIIFNPITIFITFISFYIFILFVLAFLAKKNSFVNVYYSQLIKLHLKDAEEELSNRAFILNLVISFTLYQLFAFFELSSYSGVFLSVISLLVLVLITTILPFFYVFDIGFFFVALFRGASIKKLFIFEMLNDYIHTFSFFLRINIQLIRFLLIMISVVMFDDMFINSTSLYTSYNSLNKYNSNSEFYIFYLSKTINSIFYILFEIGHFISLSYNQFAAYMLVVLFLMQFLYTSYLIDNNEEFFKNLRQNRAKRITI